MIFVYILQSTVTGGYYVGHTKDKENRLQEHNAGETGSTRSGIPWRIVHVEEFETRAAAMKKERIIKSRGIQRYLKLLIEASG